MKRVVVALVLSAGLVQAADPDFWGRLREAVRHYLGLPYVWGATGQKSFDCSGFVWRVNYESGVLMKRTTARKLYMSLPAVSREGQSQFGTIVFFDNLKHCGIVNDQRTFFHAQTSKGTNLSNFNPYWKGLVCGYRRIAP